MGHEVTRLSRDKEPCSLEATEIGSEGLGAALLMKEAARDAVCSSEGSATGSDGLGAALRINEAAREAVCSSEG